HRRVLASQPADAPADRMTPSSQGPLTAGFTLAGYGAPRAPRRQGIPRNHRGSDNLARSEDKRGGVSSKGSIRRRWPPIFLSAVTAALPGILAFAPSSGPIGVRFSRVAVDRADDSIEVPVASRLPVADAGPDLSARVSVPVSID